MRRIQAAVTAGLVALSMLVVAIPASGEIKGGCPGGFDLIKAKTSAQKQVDKAGNRDKHVCLGPNGQLKDNDK